MVSITKEERREMIKHVLKVITTIGLIIIAPQSPYFINGLVRSFLKNPK